MNASLLPVFVLAVPLVVVAVTGRFAHIAVAGAALAFVAALAAVAAEARTFGEIFATMLLALVGVFFWTAGAAVGWLSWERRHREDT